MSFSRVDQSVDLSHSANICAICLENMQDERSQKKLHEEIGAHVFHKVCVDTWLLTHDNCPLCKRAVQQLPRPLPRPEEQINNVFHRNDFAQLYELGRRTHLPTSFSNS
jgi:hypothetical protein